MVLTGTEKNRLLCFGVLYNIIGGKLAQPASMTKVTVLLLILLGAAQVQPLTAQSKLPTGYHEHMVVGTVLAVDPDHCRVTIRQANLFGYLRMDMSTYAVTQPAVLASFRRGDRIKAVFSTADGKLHRLHHLQNHAVVPSK